MKFLVLSIPFIYAFLMLFVTLKLISVQTHPVVFSVNTLGIFLIFLGLLDYRFLYFGISILLVAAILNGYFVLGKITINHHIIRFIFSGLLIYLVYQAYHR